MGVDGGAGAAADSPAATWHCQDCCRLLQLLLQWRQCRHNVTVAQVWLYFGLSVTPAEGGVV
jgi:hypothetical protein